MNCFSHLFWVQSTCIYNMHNSWTWDYIELTCLILSFFRWLITPYRDNGHLTAHQKRFNRVLSSLRQKIERAISLLKGWWRKLLFLDHLDLELEVNIIIAACVLHNFCLLNDDFDDGYFLDGDNEDNDAEQQYPDARAEQKRTHLMNIVCGLPRKCAYLPTSKCRWQRKTFHINIA